MPSSETVRARVTTCALHGVETVPVTVEIEVGPGLPGMHIVGMGDTFVQEARHRVRSAVRAAGFTAPSSRKVVVNLAPASVRKTGSGFDLPIAVAYLVATGQVDRALVADALVVGELALEGSVRAVDGMFAYAICAQRCGLHLLSGQPHSCCPDLPGLRHDCIDHLSHLRTGRFHAPHPSARAEQPARLDYQDVVGQEAAVRALTVAAAGGHGMLMVGPPGAGKSMLARRLPTILPPLDDAERVQTALIHSVAGLDLDSITAGVRPFRSPHHSASPAALVGGGRVPAPGEVSLAHNGVLFLDELGEFSGAALQALRQPMEDGIVSLSRAEWRTTFPAHFQLVAASNPCPCGYLGDRTRTCRCSEQQVRRYQGKLGGPLKDRIDLACRLSRVDPSRVLESGKGVCSAQIASEVMAARERASFRAASGVLSATTPSEVIECCEMDGRSRRLIEELARKKDLSGRAIVRVLRVARTIADLGDADRVGEEHLYEALMYRIEGGME